MLRKTLKFIGICLLLFLIFSCEHSNELNSTDTEEQNIQTEADTTEIDTNSEENNLPKQFGKIIGVNGTAIKSFFTGSYESIPLNNQNNSARSARTIANNIKLNQALLCIDSEGKVQPLQFLDSNDNCIALNVTALKKMSDKAVILSFNRISFCETIDGEIVLVEDRYASGTCLVNFATNKVYDVTGYSIDDSYYCDDVLYIKKGDWALYKIDLANPTEAIPLNNPDYMPLHDIHLVLDGWLIASVDTLVDPNGVKVPMPMKNCLPNIGGTKIHPFRSNSNSGTFAFIKDGLGQLWWFGSNKGYFRINLDEEGNLSTPDEIVADPYFTGIGIYPSDNKSYVNGGTMTIPVPAYGFISKYNNCFFYVYIQGKEEGGVDVSHVELTFSNTNWSDYVISDSIMYWYSKDTNKIFKMNLMTGEETLEYDGPLQIYYMGLDKKTLFMSGGKLLFYVFQNATTVNTYALVPGTGTPTVIAQSKMDIDNIVELRF